MSDQDRRRKHGSKKRRKKSGAKIVLGVLFGLVVVVVLAGYFAGNLYFRTHFDYGAVMNGTSLFRMTEEDVLKEVRKETDGYALVIKERAADGSTEKEILTGEDIGLELVVGDDLKKALESQSGLGWIKGFFEKHEITIASSLKLDEKKWETAVGKLQCFSKSFVQQPKDASLSEYQPGVGYVITPETQGNALDRDVAEKAINEAVRALETEVDLESTGCYKEAHIKSDDPILQERKANLEKYTNVTITYTFDDTEEVLDGDTISGWISIDETNTVTLNKDKVSDYVATLRKKYDSIFRPRTFMTTYGETVTLEDGDYGWWMNYVKEAEELAAMIEAGESGERTPVYYQTAAKYGKEDYGDSYVEVNLTAQHLFVYKDGEIVMESDFVSGKDTDSRRTPEGVYGITYKERYAKLVGEDYASPVYYWMPFNGSVGFHDATWRTNFGSDYYKGSGSHGCVNLPCSVAKELFSLIQQGTAVIVYTLPGTESDSVTTQSAADIAQTCIDAIDGLEAYATTEEQEKKSVEWCRLFYNQIGGSARSLVTNLDKLREAEENLK